MFCSNCGKEVEGNFCKYCGARLNSESQDKDLKDDSENIGTEAESSDDENTDKIIEINGHEINISQIINTYGKNKIQAITYLRGVTGVGLAEGKRIIDEAYAELYVPDPKLSFWESVKEQAKEQQQREFEKRQQEKDRLSQLDSEGTAYCPKCHSTSLSANKKGFGIGKAVVGGALLGPIGLVAGNAGAKKVRVTCMKCGHQFWAGQK